MTMKTRTLLKLCLLGELIFTIAIVVAAIITIQHFSIPRLESQASTYDYTINGERFQYATQCFTENGNLLCDAEDGTRLYVDSYTPIYYDR